MHLPSQKSVVRIIIIIIGSAFQSESKWANLGSVAWVYAGLVCTDGVKLGTSKGVNKDVELTNGQ